MAKGKKHTPEQIVSLLRQIEVAVANGKTTPNRTEYVSAFPAHVSFNFRKADTLI